jgi:hypothetical protein
LLKLAERDHSLAELIESELSLSASSEAHPVNTEAIRRRIRSSIHDTDYRHYDDYWSSGGDLDEACRVLEGAWSFIRSDDGRNALPVLEAITEEYMEAWELLDWEMMGDDGGDLLDFFEEAGAALTEARSGGRYGTPRPGPPGSRDGVSRRSGPHLLPAGPGAVRRGMARAPR